MLEEGVNDPAIFKAVFLAGGPGSGKSFIVGQTALVSLGFKLVNSDDAFEQALKSANLTATPDNIFSPKGQEIRAKAKSITKKRQDRYIEGRLGLVIDGTGKDFSKIEKQKKALETLGYDTMMILVNTDEPTAQSRNQSRDRTLPAGEVKKMWSQVQNNIGKFQNAFGRNFIVVDNSEGSNFQGGVMSAYRKVLRWSKQPIYNHRAKKWMNAERKARGMKEEKEFTPHYMYKGNQKVMAKKPEDHERLKKKGYTHDDPTTKKVEEVMDPNAGIGDYVRDFKKSDAPQFRGKSKTKRRQMAVAAYLAKKRKREDVGEANKSGDSGLRDWFGKSKSSDGKKGWVQMGGKYSGKPCARQPGQTSTPKCGSSKMKRNLNKDEEEKAFRRKNRQDPNQPDKKGGAKPTNVKTEERITEVKDKKTKGSGKKDACYHKVKSRYDVWPSAYASGALVRCRKVGAKNWGNKSEETELDEKCWKGYKKKGMKTMFGKRYPNCVKEDDVQEAPQWMQSSLSKTVYKMQYQKALPILQKLIDRKKKETGGKLHHGIEYYAHSVARQISPNVDARTLADMVENYDPNIHQWGTDAGSEYMFDMTPGEGKMKKKNCGCGQDPCKTYGKQDVKEDCGCDEEDYKLDDQDIAELEAQADSMSFDDMIEFDMYDIDDFEIDEDDPHSDVQITEVLSVQGRMKRRFAARKNKQKLKIARNLAMRRASSPDRLKKRANRGARGMIYKRILRGRSRAKLPPAERARLEKLIDTRFSGFIGRLSARMLPSMRKNEIARLKKRRGSKPKTSKKYKAAKPKAQKTQKAKKFKVKK